MRTELVGLETKMMSWIPEFGNNSLRMTLLWLHLLLCVQLLHFIYSHFSYMASCLQFANMYPFIIKYLVPFYHMFSLKSNTVFQQNLPELSLFLKIQNMSQSTLKWVEKFSIFFLLDLARGKYSSQANRSTLNLTNTIKHSFCLLAFVLQPKDL